MRSHAIVDSPVGPLTLLAVDGVLSGLFLEIRRHPPAEDAFGVRDDALLAAWAAQLGEYFAGHRTDFDLPVRLDGTPFQRTVWSALREIPYGATLTYRELAERIGRPTAARAVGLANGRNPVSIVVPCHRVVGSSGDLTGYGGGIAQKRFLLDFERGGSRGGQEYLY